MYCIVRLFFSLENIASYCKVIKFLFPILEDKFEWCTCTGVRKMPQAVC